MGPPPTAAPTRRPRAPIWPWVLLAVMVVVGVAVVRIALGSGGPPPTAREFEGECVTTSGGVIQVVTRHACDGPGEGKVVAVVDHPEDCPAGTDDRFSVEGDVAVVCIDAA